MTITDQIGRILSFDQVPQRIVSLVPSQTELLVSLGLREQLVGVTKFCVHPENLKSEKVVVGGTKKVNLEKIITLKPDLILCNKEENTKEMVEALQNSAKVHVSNVRTIEEASQLIEQYGSIFKKEDEAFALIEAIAQERRHLRNAIKSKGKYFRVGYLIWQNPLMVAGSNTFISALLEEAGFINAFSNHPERYPEVSWNDFKGLDYLFLSSEPFPFKEKHIALFKETTNTSIILVNGEYFSWYGNRLLRSLPYLKTLHDSLKS